MTADALSALVHVRELLAEPERWCQGWFAFNRAGARVYSSNPDACRWCLRGAISASTPDYDVQSEISAALMSSMLDGGPGPHQLASLYAFNDAPERTHGEVLGLIDRTIARLSDG